MNKLFRQKNLDRISSPEQLNAYIRVATPSVWVLLSAIVILLSGVCIWGIFGHMDTTLAVAAVSEEGSVTAYVKKEDIGKICEDAAVEMGETNGKVLSISTEPVCVDATFTEYMCHIGNLQAGEWVYPVELEADCKEGVYNAEIIIDSVSPMSFVLN